MPHADLILTGGPVFTGAGEPLADTAVLVTGGRIAGLVPAAEAPDHTGPATRVIDLDGALLSPSFQDAHLHPLGAGVEMLQCDLSGAESAEETLELIAAYAQAHPEREWIVGGGWSMEHFPGGTPTRGLLDELLGDRPALLINRDHHGAWANTEAMRRAGVGAATQDPADGRLEREADGFPAGTFHEGAERLFDAVRPGIGDDFALAGLLAAQEALLAQGITGWQDAWVGEGMSGISDIDAIYRRAVAEGVLKVHVRGAQWWQRDRGLEQIEGMLARREAAAPLAPAYVPGTVKIMVDGVAENQTAAMLTPYHDHSGHAGEHRGLTFVESQTLKEAVTALDAAGFQVHFHALGDRAVREALDALEAARAANGPSKNRHHLAHLQMVDEADTPRFAQLGAAANLQALWACHEEQLDVLTLPFLREGAEARHYPFGELRDRGARLVGGSDWPVSTADPLQALHVAVNREAPGESDGPLGGEAQRLSVSEFLAAYTSGSAWINHREAETGSVAEGFLADLVTISPNPFELPARELHTARVTSTWIRGERVYDAAEPASAAGLTAAGGAA
ncbi:MAG: amidohydrolase [Arthrobacter sp.]|jgi:predicted amidohydrolase YtcJ|nr:amidohydrolase [Arthrobacter sp.]